jgi:hypothetical protein
MLNTPRSKVKGPLVRRWCIQMRQLENQLENELIKHLLVQNIQESSGGLGSYSVIHFSDYDNYGSLLPWDERKWFYNRNEVSKTNRYLKRVLKEHLKINYTCFTLERHKGSYEEIREGKHLQYGDERKGKYHINILLPPISEELLKKPHSKLSRLYGAPGEIPLEQKVEIINRCFLKHPWIKKWRPSIQTQLLQTTSDQENTLHYSLKDITKKGLDFMEVLD